MPRPKRRRKIPGRGRRQATVGDGLFYDKVPELDFGGYDCRVLVGTYNRPNQNLFPEEEIGEILNDTIYAHNKKIESRFNIKFNANTINLFDLLGALRNDVKAGIDAYDMYMQIDREAYTAASEGLLYPVDKMPYVDLGQPYWCQLPNRQLSVGGRLYWGFSDEMLSFFEYTMAMYFNKKQAGDFALGDLYELVRAGSWTLDRFFEYSKSARRDMDGDGKMTEADNWSVSSSVDMLPQSFVIGGGVYLVDKDDGDIPYFSVPGNQRFFDMASELLAEFSIDGAFYGRNKAWDSADDVLLFRNGHSLFKVGPIQEMVQLRDMPDDFGVIPFPKYTSDQPRYYTRVIGGFPFVAPTVTKHPEIIGAVMEAAACGARNKIIPAYYESSLQIKYSRDTDTAEMLDLIFDTRVYDLGDTIFMDIRIDYTNIFMSKKDTFASATEKKAQTYESLIQKSIGKILELP